MRVKILVFLVFGLGANYVYGQNCPMERRPGRYYVLGPDTRTIYSMTEEQCRTTCQNDAKCPAATYHTTKRVCWLHANVRTLAHGANWVAFMKPERCQERCQMERTPGRYYVLGPDTRTIYSMTEEQCRTTCQNDAKCPAATYHTTKRVCWLHANVRTLAHGANWVAFTKPEGCRVQRGEVSYGRSVVNSQALKITLQDIANFLGATVVVHSGVRQGADYYHSVGQAADITVSGIDTKTVWDRLKSGGIMDNEYFVMYHAPGQRSCSSGTHLHIARWEMENMSGRTTCWVIEGTTPENTCTSMSTSICH
ncbi:uncharacterized protein LOC106179412 [Lingula anatina]|uniref:Uncharacterized protein LOC106179412 n=1 Tax=Lingula anatina TaxID=7574 RepID=A0A1S3K775_LINAN|nr:uncharacterized protein LOC106179412 [Lingula anatina]|eukprot:XP_013418485.1 uncharacterized protein LOC106179412 [Lingula anatina]